MRRWTTENGKGGLGGWRGGRQGEGKGIAERAEIHRKWRKRETKLTKNGERFRKKMS
jgi:hypothetical protein